MCQLMRQRGRLLSSITATFTNKVQHIIYIETLERNSHLRVGNFTLIFNDAKKRALRQKYGRIGSVKSLN